MDHRNQSLKQDFENETSLKQVLTVSEYEKMIPIIMYMEEHDTITPEIAITLTKKIPFNRMAVFAEACKYRYIGIIGSTNQSEYKRK